MGYVWFIGIVLFIILEAVTVQFVCIWFAGGAFASLIAHLLGAGAMTQVAVFAVVSAILLILSRPLVKKKLARPSEPTNADRFIGQDGLITVEVNNTLATGQLVINGVAWSVKSEDGSIIPEGTLVTIKAINGAKFVVAKKQ